MTLLRGLFEQKDAGFGTNSAPTSLTVRDDIVTSDSHALLNMWGSIALAGDYTASYEEIVRTQLWVRIAVNKIAHAMGYLPLKVYERGEGNRRERTTGSSLARLLEFPNDQKLTGDSVGFQSQIAYSLLTFGNSLIVKVQSRPDAVPSQLVPVNPRGWTVDETGDYVWRSANTAATKRFKPWQMIHISEPTAAFGSFGVSRLEAARLTLAIEYAAQRLGAATFNNGARPGGIINVKSGLPTGVAERAAAVERFKSELERRFRGVDKAGLPAVLEGDVNWMALSHNLNDSAVVAHRQLTRMEVAALFDIPQPAIGILDEANFASIDALHLMFYQDTMSWWVKRIESAFKAQLVRGVTEFENQFAEFDMDAFMRGSYLQRMQGHQIAVNARLKTPDEVRAIENDPPMVDKQPDAGLLQFPLNYGVSPASAGKEGP